MGDASAPAETLSTLGARSSRSGGGRRFAVCLALIALVGFTFRLAYVVENRHDPVRMDGTYYHELALVLADGKGFINPFEFRDDGRVDPQAIHPPLWPVALAVPSLFGFRSLREQQAFATVIGAATIVLVGLAGRRVAGARVGLVAAGIAAVYPNFWRFERELMSETLVLFGVAVVVLLSYHFWARPSLVRAIAVAIVCGLLALTHGELVLLVVALLAPLVLFAPAIPARRRAVWFACAATAMAAVIAPWAIYNVARFEEPVLLTHSLGFNLMISNCDFTYSGPRLGYQAPQCRQLREADLRAFLRSRGGGDASVREVKLRRQGLEYVREHVTRVPVVVLAREGRTWGVFRPAQQVKLEPNRGTARWVIWAGFVAYWALIPAAAAGAVVLRRRKVPLFPLLAFVAIAVIAVAITWGYTRFRAPAEVSLVLLAAVALDAILSHLQAVYAHRHRVSTDPTKSSA